MNIETCDSDEKHGEHTWPPEAPTNWCPGAAGKPKQIKATWIVVVDEPYEKTHDIYNVDTKEAAEALAKGLNDIFSMKSSDYRAEVWEAQKPPEIDDTSSARSKAEMKGRSLLPDEMAIDLEKIVKALP